MAAEPIAKISVLSSGELLLHGDPITLAELDTALADLKASRGVVWYYREEAAASAIASQVLGLVMKHRLPISLSTTPDFLDQVGVDGRSSAREP